MEKEAARPRAGAKSATAFRTISEVSDELDVPQHVLRFWETKFPQVRPLKRGGGRRYYRPEDVALLRKIQRLLYSEGYTIKGVQRLLKDQRHSGGDAEGAEVLVEGLTAPDSGGEAPTVGEVAAEGLEDEDFTGDDFAEDDAGGEEVAGDDPAEAPVPAAAAQPSQPLPPSASQPLPARSVLSPVPAAGGELPAWLRRELTALRGELTDLRTVLRKAIR